ncbi:MAG: hypothetical protein AAFR52_09440, partial [Pseudomonadota bacterium]
LGLGFGWARDFERSRERRARRALSEGGHALPEGVRAHFAPYWAQRLLNPHHGIGGEPFGASRFPYFMPELYHPESERDGYFEQSHIPPYDQDNALLLELNNDDLVGWYFGDGTLALIVPRADLSKGRLDRTIAFFGDH